MILLIGPLYARCVTSGLIKKMKYIFMYQHTFVSFSIVNFSVFFMVKPQISFYIKCFYNRHHGSSEKLSPRGKKYNEIIECTSQSSSMINLKPDVKKMQIYIFFTRIELS